MDAAMEEARQRLANMNLQQVGGVIYAADPRVPDITNQIERVRFVEMRQNDVITVGFPRSGNHWAFEVVNMVVHQTTNFAEQTFYNALLENMGENIYVTMDRMASPRILTSHNRVYRLPQQAVEKKARIIYLLRNPKDVLVSFYIFMSSLNFESAVFKGTWEEFFLLQMSGDFPWGSWFDHVLATEMFMNEYPDCPIYIHVYEEMKTNPVLRIKELCAFLGQPTTLAEQIAAATEFSNMKRHLTQGKMADLIKLHFRDDNTYFRKGAVGDWRNWFSVAQNEMFNQKFEEKMAGTRLGYLIRPYL